MIEPAFGVGTLGKMPADETNPLAPNHHGKILRT